jgi:hypothetical protein
LAAAECLKDPFKHKQRVPLQGGTEEKPHPLKCLRWSARRTRKQNLYSPVTVGTFNKAWASSCKRAGLEGLLFHDLGALVCETLCAPVCLSE